MNSKEGMDIKGNWRRAQRIDSNRKRTKEEIREAGDREREKQKTSGVLVALNAMVCLSPLASSTYT